MKKLIRAILAVLTAIPLVSAGTAQELPVQAAESRYDLRGQLIYYYREGDNQFDENRVLEKMKKVSQLDYDNFSAILNEWRWIDNEMPIPDTAPADGSITDDGTHAFVLLGGGLYKDGTLGEAGKGRCDLAYECMQAYPNSKLIITGGATLSSLKESNQTEASVMEDYLVRTKGLDPTRIMLENRATSTIYNAIYTMDLLYNQTNITSITIVSSDFHVRRGTLLFYAQSLFYSKDHNVPFISITGCAGFPDISGHENIYSEASGLAGLSGAKIPGYLASSSLQALNLNVSDDIIPTGSDALSVTAQAVYSVDSYTVDVTDEAEITQIDTSAAGSQTISASYTNLGTTVTASKTIKVVDASVYPCIMYRVYNPNTGEHFFTNSVSERKNLIRLGWDNEGIAWYRSASNTKPVYRLYNKNGSEHHYTTSAKERDSLIKAGWKNEGVGWYSETSENAVPVYRVYNPNAFSNNHHYTTSKTEAEHLVSLGWKDEGICWYGQAVQ